MVQPIADPEAVARLKALAKEHVISSEKKLHLLAKRLGIEHKTVDLRPALAQDVGKQILAPLPRYKGSSAAEMPGSRLQADLADFRNKALDKPGAHHYALMLSDVFTRQTYAEPLRVKTPEATNTALKHLLNKIPEKGRDAVLTTDAGKEFLHVDDVLEKLNAAHRAKQGRNDIAVVDRAMAELKKRLAVARANEGGTWSQPLGKVVKGYNNTPHGTVHGAPATAADENSQEFLILQDQAKNFANNRDLTNLRKQRVQEAGAFREVIANGRRGHKPRYGPARKLKEIEPGALHVVDEQGNKALLKRVQGVSAESAEPLAVFETKVQTRRAVGRKRARKPMDKKVPEAASKVFASASGPTDAEEAKAPVTASGVEQPPPPAHVSLPSQQPAPSHSRLSFLNAIYGDKPLVELTPEQRAEKAAAKAERARKKAAEEAKKQAKRDAQQAAREAKQAAEAAEKQRKLDARQAARDAKKKR